jgi:dipeptidyl aminopeptidase/acylaminoacyl peptidase
MWGRRKLGLRGTEAVAVAAGVALLAGVFAVAGKTEAQRDGLKLLEHTTASEYQQGHRNGDFSAWRKRVPAVEQIEIPSSLDGNKQRALWYDSGSRRPRPLLVVLHSWSADYEQNLDIPFAEFAIDNDWVFIHPDFRGPNRRPQATASDLAVQDVLDAVAFARARATVDGARVYLVGYSGGAMKALVLAGRHPEVWAGVAAWSPVYDIPDWYRYNKGLSPHYRRSIVASCGGPPRPGTAAEAECRERSPFAHLARAAGQVPILIAHGMGDLTVPLRHALDAYDALAAPGDRFTDEQRDYIDTFGKLPPGLRETSPRADPEFDRAGVPIRLERRSRTVTLVLHRGGHDMVYNAGLRWLSQQRRR